MAIDLNTFRPKVRRQAGNIGTCEADDDTINDKIDEALEAYSRLNPIRTVEPVAFLANDPNADFPADCFAVDQQIEVEEGSAVGGVYGSGSSNLAGYGYQHYTGGSMMQTISGITGARMVQHVLEGASQTFPSMSFYERGGKINVSPPPSSNQTFYIPLLKKHTLLNFPAQDEWILRDLAAAFILKYRALNYKFETISSSNGRRIVKFGKMRDFYNDEGDKRILKVARHYGVAPASIG